MTTRVRKAVFPAAGLGTRFLPATKAQPKEMLPLVDKPIIQYGVEEAVASGVEHIIIVTGRGKNAIEDHFDVNVELETFLEARGKTAQAQEIRARSPSLIKRAPTSARANRSASATPSCAPATWSATNRSPSSWPTTCIDADPPALAAADRRLRAASTDRSLPSSACRGTTSAATA